MSKYADLFRRGTEAAPVHSPRSADTSSGSSDHHATNTPLDEDSLRSAAATTDAAVDGDDTASASPAPAPLGRRRLIHRRRDGSGAPASSLVSPPPPSSLSHSSSGSDPAVPLPSTSPSTALSGGEGGAALDDLASSTGVDREGHASASAPAPSTQEAVAREDSSDAGQRPQQHDPQPSAASLPPTTPPSPHTLHSQDGPAPLFTCDMCLHFVAPTYAALERHALEQHGDALADYARLRGVAAKLAPVWGAVQQRKADVIQQWGRRVFAVAVQRDAGAEKMAEAHRARAQLELVVQRWHPRARVFIFGSSVAFGVWDGISDIDFTVVDVEELEAGTWPPSERNAVRSITELLRRAGFSFINLEPISHARVPIIKHHASLPIRLTEEQRHRLHEEARAAAAAACTEAKGGGAGAEADTLATSTPADATGAGAASSSSEAAGIQSQLEAELVIARSVRYLFNLPAGAPDSAIFEASIRLAVGAAAVQQVWWNRSRDMCCITFDTTTNAMRASTCPLHFISAGMRARVQPLHEECRPELYGMDFDLSFRAFGIRNSLLLRRYLLSHPCARPGALVLKDWSKTSGVNNSVNGYLTSYAVNIMWIYYLVHRGVIPYVCPARDIPASLRGGVSPDPKYAAMVDPTWSAETRAALEAQAGELLLGFFYYYAFEFDWANHVVSLNRPGITTKASIGWDVEDVGPSGGAMSPHSAAAAAGASPALSLSSARGGAADAGQGGAPSAPAVNRAPPLPPPPLSIGNASGGVAVLSSVPAMEGGGGGGLVSSAAFAARRSRATTRYAFCIEDPYEENLNLGRHMGVTKTLRVQTELYRGLLSLLKDDAAHCCVFAAGAGDAAAGAGARSGATPAAEVVDSGAPSAASGAAAAAAAAAEPTELPVRVLYKLMATSTRELALARARHSASSATSGEFPGVVVEELTAALAAQAPVEYKLATRVWNTHQLLHRLGLKLHASHYVLPRREVGGWHYAAHAPPAGVVAANTPEPTLVGEEEALGAVPTEHAASPAAAATAAAAMAPPGAPSTAVAESIADVAQKNRELLSTVPRHRLPDDLLLALTSGYTCLTPRWVAWSKPWAALSAWWTDRQYHMSNSNGSGDVSMGDAGPLRGPPSGGGAARAPHAGAVPEQAVGAMRQTRPQLQQPRALTAAGGPSRAVRLLFRH